MRTERLTRIALLTALSMVFSYVETLIPIPIGVPGIKLGLANVVVVFALYSMDSAAAFTISILRVVLLMALFGNPATALYSLAGALVSLSGMLLLKKAGIFSLPGVSMAGGALHNIAQVAVACLVVKTVGIISYLVVLIPVGLFTGFLMGLVAERALKRLK